MNTAIDPNIYTDNRGLSSLRAAARSGDTSEQTLRQVAGQFEAIFVNQMLKTMREASLGEGIMDSDQTKFYQSMFDQQMAQEMTRGRGLGLAELLVRQLSPGQDHGPPSQPASPLTGISKPAPAAAQVVGRPASPVAPGRSENRQTDKVEERVWNPQTPAEFLRDLWPHARDAAHSLGTRPEVLLAQAALESGWGQHQMRHADGRPAYNLFGIKADQRWQGERVQQPTLEFRDGMMRREQAAFRAYASPAESFRDYAAFIRANPRYQAALGTAANGGDYVREIHRAGYATDPDYQNKINEIMNSPRFRKTLAALKNPASGPLLSLTGSTARERLVVEQRTASLRSGEV